MKQKTIMEKIDFNSILEEYKEDNSIFSNESDQLRKIKYTIWHELDDTDRRILLLYSETGNMRDTAKMLRVSASTICLRVKKIRDIFYKE